MSKTLFWIQAGGCGGDSMAVLGSKSPDLSKLYRYYNIEFLWHPSFSARMNGQFDTIVSDIDEGKTKLDILCVEGALMCAPDGTGHYDTVSGIPKIDIISKLAARAEYVIAIGTCAGFGGFTAEEEFSEAKGLQFLKNDKNGLLSSEFRAGSGYPVINLPGCPVMPAAVESLMTLICEDQKIVLNYYNMPRDWFNVLVHQGCTRNEYHEFRVEETEFGRNGCLFFYMGCRGPMTYSPCNKTLWNRKNSKPRSGIPCLGCTNPMFPQKTAFFETRNIEGVPLDLPDGMDRAHYLAYKTMAAASAPDRLKQRNTNI